VKSGRVFLEPAHDVCWKLNIIIILYCSRTTTITLINLQTTATMPNDEVHIIIAFKYYNNRPNVLTTVCIWDVFLAIYTYLHYDLFETQINYISIRVYILSLDFNDNYNQYKYTTLFSFVITTHNFIRFN